jgi:hypothetical protein
MASFEKITTAAFWVFLQEQGDPITPKLKYCAQGQPCRH